MNTALIVVDVQESFRARPEWAAVGNPGIAGPVGRLVAHARARGVLVVWVLHEEPGSGGPFDPLSGHVRLLDELDGPRPGEPLLRKTSHNAFTTTNLQQLLVRAGVREVWVCGIRTEQCVETTTRLASDLGYDTVFVTDATTTDGAGGFSPAEITARTEAVLRDRFARITTVADLVATADGQSTPATEPTADSQASPAGGNASSEGGQASSVDGSVPAAARR